MSKNKVSILHAFKEFIWPRKGIIFVGLILIVISRLASLVLPMKSKELILSTCPKRESLTSQASGTNTFRRTAEFSEPNTNLINIVGIYN